MRILVTMGRGVELQKYDTLNNNMGVRKSYIGIRQPLWEMYHIVNVTF